MLNGGAEMVVKGGKKNEKETASIERLGKREKTEKGIKRRKEMEAKLVARWGRGDGGKRRKDK